MSTLFSWGLRAVSAIVRLARRRPWLSATLALALLAVVSVSGFWWYANNRWQSARKATDDEKFREAQPHLDFCLKVWPSSSEVHLLAARVARRLGDLGTAEEHLNRCRELEKGATQQVQLEFLLLRTQAGEVDEIAPALFDLVDKRHPDSREILDTITRVYSTRLRYKPAYASLSKWMEVEPEYAKPYYWRGWVLERLNNQKAATADYHRALELDPDMV
ncbi:MAG: tetratricopeptide repeat protein, partial [Fimbriiglobus sp.]|nr:tetratricopeptide repeat protein [Fimbriiglobus sp.]